MDQLFVERRGRRFQYIIRKKTQPLDKEVESYIFNVFFWGVILSLVACTLPTENPSIKGEKLAQTYCSTCHQFPKPQELDLPSWEQHILPRMGYMMGIYENSADRNALIEQGEGGQKVLTAGTFPEQAILDQESWELIRAYYLDHAPEVLETSNKSENIEPLIGFKIQIPPHQFSPPSSSLVQFSSNGELFLGDIHTQKLYAFDQSQNLLQAANTRDGVVHLRETPQALLLTVIGSFSPTDKASGFVFRLPTVGKTAPSIVLPKLQRPVHSAYADLNQDGLEDIVVCEFGKWTGRLAWWEQLPNGQFKPHTLWKKPGATRSFIGDMNGDQLPDIVAMFAQGDEGIFIWNNQGRGKFNMQRLLEFPASWGSSYFDLVDMNDDGHLDILHTAGDNADFPPILKPYHGIRIFLNDGQGAFIQEHFFQMHGAYKAIAKDFDQDGDLDMAAISFFADYQHQPTNGFYLLENQGDFKMKKRTFPEASLGRWITMDSGDFDQDGDDDIVLGSLAFEVPGQDSLLNQWKDKGIPYLILKNQFRTN